MHAMQGSAGYKCRAHCLPPREKSLSWMSSMHTAPSAEQVKRDVWSADSRRRVTAERPTRTCTSKGLTGVQGMLMLFDLQDIMFKVMNRKLLAW